MCTSAKLNGVITVKDDLAKKIKKNWIFVFGVLLLVGAYLALDIDLGSLSVSGYSTGVISQSAVYIEDPNSEGLGSGYWWKTLAFSESTAKNVAGKASIIYEVSTPDTVVDGDTEITPTKGIEIQFGTTPKTCIVYVGDNAESYTSLTTEVVSGLYDLTGDTFNVYAVGTNKEKHMVDMEVYKTEGSSSELIDEIEDLDFTLSETRKVTDGEGGTLYITTLGETGGTVDCASLGGSGYRILETNGKYYLVDTDEFVKYLDDYYANSCWLPIVSDYKSSCVNAKNYFSDPSVPDVVDDYDFYSNLQNGYLYYNINAEGAGIGLFLIEANADFFEAATEVKSTSADPEITDVRINGDLIEGIKNLIEVDVRNNGADGLVTVTPTSDYGTFSPISYSQDIDEDDTETFSFYFKSGNIPSDEDSTDGILSVKACSGLSCDTETVSIEIYSEDSEEVDTSCDGTCDILDYIYCPSDCEVTSTSEDDGTCDGPYMYADSEGACYCKSGYTMTIQNGELVCIEEEEEEDQTLLIAALGIVLFVLLMAIIWLLLNRRKASRGRRR